MKYRPPVHTDLSAPVAPLAGAWIEITSEFEDALSDIVAPLAGAWIEILNPIIMTAEASVSLPLRERGLKFNLPSCSYISACVAPLAGAWIEIASWKYVVRI